MEEVASMPSNAQEFCLRWNNFHSSLISALDGFKNDLDFVDVTLACEGQFLKAHKMLLSACSVFFRDLLKANPCQHPIVILPPEVRFIDLEKMLRFIYQGEVNVHQENLARFLKTAEMLKIRGLAEDNEKQKSLQPSSPRTSESNGGERLNDSSSPKRPRLSIDAQSGSLTDHPPTPNDDSHLSGPDSDSEMIPVKQEMIELKECDFEGAESDSFLAENYLRETSTATSSNNNSSTQPQTHPAAPPPPGPLLPSYVPPPQVKAQDDSSLAASQEEISQGTFARLAPDLSAQRGGEGEGLASSWTPGQARKSSSPRYLLALSASSSKYPSAGGTKNSPVASASSSPLSPESSQKFKVSKRSPSHRGSPGQCSPGSLSTEYSTGTSRRRGSPGQSNASGYSPGSPSTGCLTGTSRSIWHPPVTSPLNEENSRDTPTLTLTPVSGTNNFSTSLTCDICSKTFTSRSNLNKHKRVQHSGEEYTCPVCHRKFKNRYYIKDHVNICTTNKKSGAAVGTQQLSEDDDSFNESGTQPSPRENTLSTIRNWASSQNISANKH